MPADDGEDLRIPRLDLLEEPTDDVDVAGIGCNADNVGFRAREGRLEVLFLPQVEDAHVVILAYAGGQIL